MKASDFRIGNLIYHNQVVKEIIALAHEDIVVKNFGGLPDSFQPIPLTEEWLLKFNPEDITTCDEAGISIEYLFNNKVCIHVDYQGNISFRSNIFNKIDLKYVHQFQNLCFALTEEELTIKS